VPGFGRKPQPAEPSARTILLGGEPIPYLLKRSSRRTIGFRIDRHGLTVSAPLRTPQSHLDRLLAERAAWVVAKLREWRERQPEALAWVDGEILHYLGGELRLALRQGNGRTARHGDDLLVSVPDPADADGVQKKVRLWYRRQAAAFLAQRVGHYAPRMGLAVPRLALSGARTRWGSCNARGEIRLNWRLMQAPISQIDYVVVHELAHIVELNHSPRFWAVVAEHYPQWQKARRDLRHAGERYHRL